ncbi:MAG TPA: AraC family ligand binding domain-containing protein [Longimicrobium sp.]|jgi:quercetin dioxygenase-like cupin family protein|nr:AraC family ligand binding domain-containing protein [Longimicrobium sp.]
MSSINRPLAGPTLSYDLAAEAARLRQDPMYQQSGKLGHALVKNGRFRVILTALAAGQSAETANADSAMSIQVLEGSLQVRADGGEQELRQGQLIFTAPGDAHDIRAAQDSLILITVSAQNDDFRPGESRTGSGANP